MCTIEKLYYLRQNPYDNQSIRLRTSGVDIRVFCVVKYQVKLRNVNETKVELNLNNFVILN